MASRCAEWPITWRPVFSPCKKNRCVPFFGTVGFQTTTNAKVREISHFSSQLGSRLNDANQLKLCRSTSAAHKWWKTATVRGGRAAWTVQRYRRMRTRALRLPSRGGGHGAKGAAGSRGAKPVLLPTVTGGPPRVRHAIRDLPDLLAFVMSEALSSRNAPGTPSAK